MKLISACLAGVNCKYDGTNSKRECTTELVQRGEAILLCPEQLGGLPTPRSPAEIVGGTGEDVLDGTAKIYTVDGIDVTSAFIRGARETLYLARLINAQEIILKQKSPSCGCGKICDGTFTKTLRDGNGVTAALLFREKFVVRAI